MLSIYAPHQRLGVFRPCTKRRSAAKEAHRGGRHALWRHSEVYEKMRDGIPVASEADIQQLARSGALTEGHFFLFRHRDQGVPRNATLPRYEAVWRCGNRWLLAQKGHLRQAYAKEGRVHRERAWSMMGELPYWVDRYAFSKMKKPK